MTTNKIFGQMYLEYNHVSHINQENIFLLIFTDLGTVLSSLDMLAPSYAIASINFPLNNSRDNFKKTQDIGEIAKKYKLPNSHLPTGEVFYYVGKYRMATNGIALITLTISEFGESSDLFYEWFFQYGTFKRNGYCNPLVHISNW